MKNRKPRLVIAETQPETGAEIFYAKEIAGDLDNIDVALRCIEDDPSKENVREHADHIRTASEMIRFTIASMRAGNPKAFFGRTREVG